MINAFVCFVLSFFYCISGNLSRKDFERDLMNQGLWMLLFVFTLMSLPSYLTHLELVADPITPEGDNFHKKGCLFCNLSGIWDIGFKFLVKLSGFFGLIDRSIYLFVYMGFHVLAMAYSVLFLYTFPKKIRSVETRLALMQVCLTSRILSILVAGCVVMSPGQWVLPWISNAKLHIRQRENKFLSLNQKRLTYSRELANEAKNKAKGELKENNSVESAKEPTRYSKTPNFKALKKLGSGVKTRNQLKNQE